MTSTRTRPATDGRWSDRPIARVALLLVGTVVISTLGGLTRRVRATDAAAAPGAEFAARVLGSVEHELEDARGQLAVQQLQLERLQEVVRHSARHQIPADLAGAIYDIAISEGIDPALGFELVRVESGFKARARSHRDALGYTQVRLATARQYEPGVTEESLFQRDVNLRIGFRFLRDLLRQYRGNLELALLAYNRGPGIVNGILAEGGDPRNGYSDQVMSGVRRVVN